MSAFLGQPPVYLTCFILATFGAFAFIAILIDRKPHEPTHRHRRPRLVQTPLVAAGRRQARRARIWLPWALRRAVRRARSVRAHSLNLADAGTVTWLRGLRDAVPVIRPTRRRVPPLAAARVAVAAIWAQAAAVVQAVPDPADLPHLQRHWEHPTGQFAASVEEAGDVAL